MEITPRGERSGALAAFGIQAGPMAGEEVPIRLPVVRIGRAAGNDVVIDEDSISATHARLEFDEGAWRITDLESTNGTYVEGVRLAPQVPTPLVYGASVRFGGVRLHFRAVEAADPAAARAGYVEPERAPTIREAGSGGRRIPMWLVLLLLLLLAAAVAFFTTFNPTATPDAAAPEAAAPAATPAPTPEVAPPAAAPEAAVPAPLPADTVLPAGTDTVPAGAGDTVAAGAARP
jgi:Na+-transporting methylmalonyl-CoA/oxaloacetate decarboxylase gamma subunit